MLQKKILRVITFSDKNVPSAPIFDSLKVFRFDDIIIMHIVSFVYECVHTLSLPISALSLHAQEHYHISLMMDVC